MTRFDSALDAAAAIRSRAISPTEVLEHYLAEVDRLDPTLNAFAWRDDERALADAAAATEQVANSAPEDLPTFHGVPLPIKDLTRVEGWPTTYGSRCTDEAPEPSDEAITRRFRDAGFVLMGKTTLPEFGSVSVTESQRFGATRNPWNPDHTPGGSSGGAASAVAAGLAPIAHANDGGGSIRIPASCCGLVGLKASRNRVPDDTELMAGLAGSGVVTRTVADTAAVLDALAVRDAGAWNAAPAPTQPFSSEVGAAPGRLRVRIGTGGPLGLPTDPDVDAAIEATRELLVELGHEVVVGDLVWPEPAAFLTDLITVWSTISANVPVADPAAMEPHDFAAFESASVTSALDYSRAIHRLQLGSREITSQFGRDFDVLVTPTMAIEPPQVGAIFEGADLDPNMPILNSTPMATYTAPFNVTGQPAMSLPLHVAASGLPVGVQFVGGPWQEAVLIRLASQVENARPWSDRWPTI